jgi:peroxiredoxin
MSDSRSDAFKPGHHLPDLAFSAPDGSKIRLGDYYNRMNMLLFWVGIDGIACVEGLLAEISEDMAGYRAENAKILLILAGSKQHVAEAEKWRNLPFQVLADPEGEAQLRMGLTSAGESMGAAACVVDRFGRITFAWRDGRGEPPPTSAELLAQLRAIELEGPE